VFWGKVWERTTNVSLLTYVQKCPHFIFIKLGKKHDISGLLAFL